MKVKQLVIAGIAALSFTGAYQLLANAKTTTYTAKVSRSTLYRKLPTTKNVKTKKDYKLSGDYTAKSVKTAHGVRYAFLVKGSQTIGWFKLSDLKTTTTKDKQKKADNKQTTSAAQDDSDTTSSNSTTTTTNTNANSQSSNTSTPATTSSTTTSTTPTISTSIPNMDYSYSASNNPSSDVTNLMNQTGVNWNSINVQSAAAQATFNAINRARAGAGVAPLTINDELTKIAQTRVKQVVTNFTHYDSNNYMIAMDDANQLNLNITQWASQISENLGESYYLDNDTPTTAAERIVNQFQAEGPDNGDGKEHGHYVEDMDPTNTQVGISFYHGNNNDTFVAIIFAAYKNN
ncbi:CAP domain-containing protein [Nicoliella lavandulae]|uniref:CAP domain-containing protein n=1 Tax=Nicoliella lavandulae TaxID=3082954 RepID=A0ABU8SJ15_9LACO